MDRLHGPVEAVVDDLVLWRNDDTPAYNLAVVVDDADQGVGEVVRGDDLLETTPRQAARAAAARACRSRPTRTCRSCSVPTAQRLAKRHGAVTLADRAARGETPADVLAWMARSLELAEPGEPVDRRCCSRASTPARCRAPLRAGGERDGGAAAAAAA